MNCTTHHFACDCREEEFKKLKQQLDECAQKYLECSDKYSKTANKILELKEKLSVCVEALMFYADPGIYDHVHSARIGVNNECGDKAREALKKIGEVK